MYNLFFPIIERSKLFSQSRNFFTKLLFLIFLFLFLKLITFPKIQEAWHISIQ